MSFTFKKIIIQEQEIKINALSKFKHKIVVYAKFKRIEGIRDIRVEIVDYFMLKFQTI